MGARYASHRRAPNGSSGGSRVLDARVHWFGRYVSCTIALMSTPPCSRGLHIQASPRDLVLGNPRNDYALHGKWRAVGVRALPSPLADLDALACYCGHDEFRADVWNS